MRLIDNLFVIFLALPLVPAQAQSREAFRQQTAQTSAASAPKTAAKPAPKVVYRDRPTVKVVEKVVYRDRPTAAPVAEAAAPAPPAAPVAEAAVPPAYATGQKVSLSGLAAAMPPETDPTKYLALHRTAARGTVVYVKNPQNGKGVYVRVSGSLPASADAALMMQLSPRAIEKLQATDARFTIEASYQP